MMYFIMFFSYCIGSIPFGLILTKLKSGVDIRTIGSGNIGATNVLRTGNKYLAILTLLFDGLKAGIPLILASFITSSFTFEEKLLVTAAAILGHLFPIFLEFKGGKGIATLFGSLLFLNPTIALISSILWILIAFISRYSSVASLGIAISLPFYGYYLAGYSFLVWSAFLGFLILYKHKENIIRLYQGKESRIHVNS